MEEIKVSIITPSYNQGAFVEDTIKSVLNQTYKNIEYLVLDACSTDNTIEVLKKYALELDQLVVEKDNGQTDAINRGFKMASGQLVGWINSDDILYPDCVERIVEAYKAKPDSTIFYNSICDIIDAEGVVTGKLIRKIPDFKHLLQRKYKVLQPGSFYAKKAVSEVNYLDDKIQYCMDLDLWLKLLKKGGIYDIGGSASAAYRDWELTKTSTGGGKFYYEILKTLTKHGAVFYNKTILNTGILYIKSCLKGYLSSAK